MHLNLSQSSVDTTEPWVIVIGLLGMIISVLANIESAEEMYPLFLSRRLAEQASKRTSDKTGSVFSHIPSSVKMAFVSDACISVYGVYHQDILVGLYGALNSLVILFTIFSIFEEAQRERPGSAAPDVWVQGMHVAAYC